MAWTKVKTAAVIGVVALFAAGAATVTVKEIHESHARPWRTEHMSMNLANVLNAMSPVVEILPTKFPATPGWLYGGRKMAGVNRSLRDLLYFANATDFGDDRMIFPSSLPTNRFDFVVNQPTNSTQSLKSKIESQFGWTYRIETIETNILVLKTANPNAPGLKPHHGRPNVQRWQFEDFGLVGNSITATDLAHFLEMYLAVPVVDQSGLTNHYDIGLKLKMKKFPSDWKDHHIGDFQPALRDQLGLELVPTNMPVQMLIVKKAQ